VPLDITELLCYAVAMEYGKLILDIKEKMMVTGAELQKRYRENRKTRGYRQINAWISPEAAFALLRIAEYYRTTKQDVLERLLLNEQDRIMRDRDTDHDQRRDEFLLTKKE